MNSKTRSPLSLVGLILIGALCLSNFGHAHTSVLLGITAPWRYTTNNVSLSSWTAKTYLDSDWNGPSNALFFIETAALPAPKSTPLPPNSGANPTNTYYFRTTFTVTNIAGLASLTFSNLVDDGAVLYLNGVEIQRLRMPTGTVTYTTAAAATVGDATVYDVFTLGVGALPSLVEGTNCLAVEVHQPAAASSDIVFGSAVSGFYGEQVPAITRGPYLQLSTPTGIVIRWRTDIASDSRVVFGASTGSLTTTNYNAASVTEHEVTLTGLTPDTRYFYAAGTAAGNLSGPDTNLYFYTHPLSGTPKPMRVWVIGDAGTGDGNQTGVRDAFLNWNGTNRVHAWLQLGDNAYNSGTDAEYQANMFNIYTNQLRNLVTWPTLGNHETVQSYTYADTYPHFLVFTLPTGGEAGGVTSSTEHYYSFDYGMVHFICLDSMTSDLSTNTPASGSPGGTGAMAQWLRDDLAATTNRWIIAYWHHPPYTKGSHDSDSPTDSNGQMTKLRERFLPLLEAGGVDLVLSGHSHVYERTCLINGHYGLSGTFDNATMIVQGGNGRDANAYLKPENAVGTPIGNRGAVYTVCGNSGANGSLMTLPASWSSMMMARYPGSGTTHGSMALDITTNRLDLRFITQDGVTTNDWFTIRKDNWAPVASNDIINIPANTSTNLVFKGSDINRNPITFATNSVPTNGLISAFDSAIGAFTYTPARGATNNEALRFVVNDGRLTSTGVVAIAIAPSMDANTNGLPDSWEAQYGLTDPNGDSDGDGASNLQEYWAGTNPTNALSWLHIIAIGKAGAGFQVVWSSVGGTRYRVCYSDGDAQGGFNGLFTAIPRGVEVEMNANPTGMPGTMSFTDDFTLTGGAPAQGSRYYRLQVVR